MRHSWKETNLSHPCRTSWTPNEVFLRDCQTLPCWLPTWTPGRKELKWKEQPLLIIRWLHRSIWRISKKVKLQWKANYTLKSISPLLSESNLSKYEFIKNICLQKFSFIFFGNILPCKYLVDKGFCFGSRQDGAEYFTLKYIITYYILRYTISYLYISIILSFVIVPLGLSSMKPLHEKIFFLTMTDQVIMGQAAMRNNVRDIDLNHSLISSWV